MPIYRDLKEALDLAANPATSYNDLRELVKSDFIPVLKLVVMHPHADADLIRLCTPKALNLSQEFDLLSIIASQAKTPYDVLQNIGNMLKKEKLTTAVYQLALAYYSRPDVSQADIEDFVVGRSANSKFRNELWKKTSRPKIKQFLDKIKKENKTGEDTTKFYQVLHNQNKEKNESATNQAQQQDPMLIGAWTWSDVSLTSSYGLNASVSVHETYVFFHNGQFYRTTKSFASYQLDQVNESITPEHRGRWSSQAGQLILEWDDTMVSKFSYFIANNTLQLSSSDNQRYYLKH